MTELGEAEYPVIEIQPDWVLEPEALGSKEKFWFRREGEETERLFKFTRPDTGEHWSEKIAAEVAAGLQILHARVELAVFQGRRGSASESFARGGRNLFHGNQMLAGKVLGYDVGKRFGQCDHTLANIYTAIDRTFPHTESARRAKEQLAEYLVLDALIGNTDRHHENWGILLKRVGGVKLMATDWREFLAPTFDHASSLGRELVDTSEGKSRDRLLREDRVGEYAESARGAIYWERIDRHGLSPLELVRRAALLHRDLFGPALTRLDRMDRRRLQAVVNPVPASWMTPLQREFAVELMCYNHKQLREIVR